MTQIDNELAIALRHVIEGRLIVARQRDRIARLKALGSCTRNHEQTLDIFVSTLQILEEHERELRASVEKLRPRPHYVAVVAPGTRIRM